MDLTSKDNIKKLFGKHETRSRKRLGQNFLVDKRVLGKIIEAANLGKEDTVLEIGAGIGTLTLELAKKAKKVIAVEKDPKMCEILHETMKGYENVEIIQGDILKLEIFNFQFSIFKQKPNAKNQMPKTKCKIQNTRYKVVANLPYYITSPVIRKFLEAENPPSEMILMVQKEVAQRICARPPRMNLLAVSVQFYAEPKIVSYVSKNSFWPSPKVDSAIIQITPLINADRKQINADLFFKVVKAGFSQPRKQILNNLSKGLALRSSTAAHSKPSPNGLALSSPNGLKLEKEAVQGWLLKNNIQPTQRAETLSIRDWINLTNTFVAY